MNSLNSKIVSIVLLIILVLPVFVLPFASQRGQVLGVNSVLSNDGNIAGGVSTLKNSTTTGLIVLDETLNEPIINENIAVNNQIDIKNGNYESTISGQKLETMDASVVAKVDLKTFQSLGGDVNTKTPLAVNVLNK